jgi:hypothetical protein
MGIEIEINSLEDMCDLMCYNKIPKRRNKMIDIKPCPFCGGEAKVKKAPWDRSEEGSSVCEVYCTECHASIYGETFNFYQVKYDSDNPQDKISAIEKWNRRK